MNTGLAEWHHDSCRRGSSVRSEQGSIAEVGAGADYDNNLCKPQAFSAHLTRLVVIPL